MGQKYQIDVVLGEALKRLYREFPVELGDFDTLGDWTMISNSGGNDFDIVNLAREQNLLSVLPLALHCCGGIRSNTMVKGVKREDHTVATLSPMDEKAVFAASHPRLILMATTTFSWLDADGSDDCETREECDAGRNQILRDSFFPYPVHNCLATWQQEWEVDMCGDCISKAQYLHSIGRQRYWDALPSTFGLPDWEELKKERILSIVCVPTVSVTLLYSQRSAV